MSTLTTNAATEIVDATARLLTEHYVFPDVAEQLAVLLRRRLAEGAYDVASAAELGALVTADLQSAHGDPHLRLLCHSDATWLLHLDPAAAVPTALALHGG
ncbi:hypothetical protein [Streptomyces sp. NPDC088794]|uniref:hypothetical protein n=1 Tax=Streptomyces sp. NPDC088794 TaxID=3365902 RepID=UPI0037F5F0A7